MAIAAEVSPTIPLSGYSFAGPYLRPPLPEGAGLLAGLDVDRDGLIVVQTVGLRSHLRESFLGREAKERPRANGVCVRMYAVLVGPQVTLATGIKMSQDLIKQLRSLNQLAPPGYPFVRPHTETACVSAVAAGFPVVRYLLEPTDHGYNEGARVRVDMADGNQFFFRYELAGSRFIALHGMQLVNEPELLALRTINQHPES